MVDEELVQVVERLVREFIAGFLELFESSGKTSHTMSHAFSMSAMRLLFCLAWKEKGGEVGKDFY